MMDKQTFSSIQATMNTSRYAAAVFRKGTFALMCLITAELYNLCLAEYLTVFDRGASSHAITGYSADEAQLFISR